MTKREFKKYRKDTLKEIHYQNIYADGVIETEQGRFTKTYVCNCDSLQLFDLLHKLYNPDGGINLQDYGLDKLEAQITYFNRVFYLTFALEANSYEECVDSFAALEELHYIRALGFMDRMKLLHAMYQNDDRVEDRYNTYALKKNEAEIPSDFAMCMKNFKKNKKISKDLILPMYMKTNPMEMEFEGNYVRFFYFKNTPRYLTKVFIEDLRFIENAFFSIHLKPLNQTDIVQYVEGKYEDVKELKETELIQKRFFDTALPELKKSAKRDELMFLFTLVIGMPNDSIDELDDRMNRLTRDMEETYVLKVLKYQQKDAFDTFLPFCNDKLDIQSTIYKIREKGGV